MLRKSIYWLASLFITLALIASTTLVAHAIGHASPLNAAAGTFTPAADAYVISTSATTNYGTNTSLRVDSSPTTVSYLRFVVTGLNGAAVQSAVLRIYANSANTTGFSVKAVADNTWVENKITYSNAPAAGSTIASSKAFTAGTWVTVDLTGYVKAEGTYNLELATTNSTNTNLAAREARGECSPTGAHHFQWNRRHVDPRTDKYTHPDRYSAPDQDRRPYSHKDRHSSSNQDRRTDPHGNLCCRLHCGGFDQRPDLDLYRKQYHHAHLLAVELQCDLPDAMGHQHQLCVGQCGGDPHRYHQPPVYIQSQRPDPRNKVLLPGGDRITVFERHVLCRAGRECHQRQICLLWGYAHQRQHP